MLKSLFEWLVQTQPLPNWLIIVWLFGLTCISAGAVVGLAKKNGEE